MLPAMAVGILLVMLWYVFAVPAIWGPQGPAAPTPPGPDGTTPPTPPPDNGTPTPPPTVPPDPTLPSEPPQAHEATFGNLRLTFSNVGARIVGMTLVDARIDLVPPDQGAFVLRHVGTGDNLEGRGWKMTASATAVEFETVAANGLTVRKSFAPGPTPDQIRVTIDVRNGSAAPVPFAGAVDVFAGIEHDGPYRYDEFIEALLREGRALRRYKYDEDVKRIDTPQAAAVEWFGVKNRYFLVAAWPAEEADRGRCLDVDLLPHEIDSRNPAPQPAEKRENIAAGVRLMATSIEPGQTVTVRFDAYAGPLKAGRLPDKLGDPDEVINWNGFDFIGHVLIWLIGLFKNVNWGLGIIVTTLIVRIFIAPLSMKSQSSMMKMGEMMKKLKPQIDALKERYGDDPQKFQEEQLALMRKEGFNPMSQMGGCLPMFVQLPVFIGMYSVLNLAVDLRHAEFLWISDLSQPDRTIPFPLFGLEHINVLPIVMGITWTLQSFLTPMTSTDPQQVQMQKMMRFMPVVFVFFCYGLASGLSLYFFINSLLSIFETKFVRKYFIKPQS